MAVPENIKQISEAVWELDRGHKSGMRVPARIIATHKLLEAMDKGVFDQTVNVATLPGITKYSFCMPDGHWGYGFPIGGVAAMDPSTGVISPGGIGFDINCGMRLAVTNLTYDELEPKMNRLVDRLYERIPAGVGRKGLLDISQNTFRRVIERGATWCVERGMGRPEDLERTEESGCVEGADASTISERAIERGYHQIGTLGSGNHYLEIQVVREENIFDTQLARAFGITKPNQIVVMFHCGSRGFGHQVATDYVQKFVKAMGPKYGITVIDRDLACAPFDSQDGRDYFAAMKCAINMSFANRQVILHHAREVFAEVLGKSEESLGMDQVYDVAHNTAKLETHTVDGEQKELLVHRKGATRAFGPGNPELPERYLKTGQPVIIGGSMETGSFLLAGTQTGDSTFFSTAHGSGRVMSRRKARHQFYGRQLQDSMRSRGIYIRSASSKGLAEEAGAAYKDIDAVVEAATLAGISKAVVKLVPVGNIKG
ncbi:MAG: RNA-splicing ligase RtcB [Chitinivibrionales bacterium]|nr:RNA-splicing ligase RtcB [Chitinivibrionales bacterium]